MGPESAQPVFDPDIFSPGPMKFFYDPEGKNLKNYVFKEKFSKPRGS